MARILGLRYEKGKLPLKEINKDEFLKKAGEWLKAHPDVKFNGTFANDDGMGVCDWEAPNIDIIKQAAKDLGAPPYDIVIEVKQVLP